MMSVKDLLDAEPARKAKPGDEAAKEPQAARPAEKPT